MKTYGIVGHPVIHSLSPAMHNAAIRHLKIDAEYQRFDIDPDNPDNLANFCYETDVNNIGGFSVTMPYKREIMAYMDHYDPLAKIVESVNTVVNENSKLIGYNTDAMGALQALREKTVINRKKALIMGAGGAARAIAYSLKEYGAEVFVFNRTPEKAEDLADKFKIETIEFRHIPQGDFSIIVNATPVGSLPNSEESLLNAGQIPEKAVVLDIVTNPIRTRLLKEAEKAGATPISGERMLLWQAVDQFKLFFGYKAPAEVMEKALYEELEKRK